MAKSKTSDLTDKQEMFCREYVIDFNGTQAAIRSGYSKKTARQIADENLSKPDIQNFIKELTQKKAERCEITSDMVLRELAKIGFSNLDDFIENDYTLKPLSDIDKSKMGAIQSIQKDINEGDNFRNESVKFKLHDKLSALEKIAKHIGFFEKDNEQKKREIVSNLTEEQIKALNKQIDGKY